MKDFYDAPKVSSSRFATLGKGSRISILRKKGKNYCIVDNVPAPGEYDSIGSFNKIKPSKAFSFGSNRDAYNKVYCIGSLWNDPDIPGPGKYPIQEFMGREGLKFSLKPKAKNSSRIKLKIGFINLEYKSPGPCAYEVNSLLNPTGNYFISKYKGPCCGKFNPPKSNRFLSILVRKNSTKERYKSGTRIL